MGPAGDEPPPHTPFNKPSNTLRAQPTCREPPKKLGTDAHSDSRTRPHTALQVPAEASEDQLHRIYAPGAVTAQANDAETGGVSLRSCERASTSSVIARQNLSTELLVSPTRTANIRTRRSNHVSTLLQSPARAGYATRMRQLFEDNGHDHVVKYDNCALYPQLPNVSRRASPPPIRTPVRSNTQGATERVASTYRPESLCLSRDLSQALSLADYEQTSLPHLSERSSGSWSDDSGYLITASRGRSVVFTIPLEQRIHDWLAEVFGCENDLTIDDNEISVLDWRQRSNLTAQQHYRSVGTRDNFLDIYKPTPLPEGQAMLVNPFVSDDKEKVTHRSSELQPPSKEIFDTPSPHHEYVTVTKSRVHGDTALETGGIQLSPLSPNVCIERGPSRYHSNRKPRDASNMTTPCKDGRVALLPQTTQLQESVVPSKEGINGLLPRSDAVATGFRRFQ